MRILLHPGFHKTGTTSLQRGAEARMDQLAPHLRLMVTADVIKAARAARKYSAHPDREKLRKFQKMFKRALPAPSDHALLISCEDLSGFIPGIQGVTAYDAAPDLMQAATQALRRVYGEPAEIMIWYTTRAAKPWKRSVYYQNLRASRLTIPFKRYQVTLNKAADLTATVSAVRDRVAAEARVLHTAIEDCSDHPLGPLGTALDHLNIPTENLTPIGEKNVQPGDIAKALLELNRSALSDETLAEAKRELLSHFRANPDTNLDGA